MLTSNKKKIILNKVTVSLGCGSCRKPKLSNIFHPKPKPKIPSYQKHHNRLYFSSSTSSRTNTDPSPNQYDTTPTTFSPAMDTPPPQYFWDSATTTTKPSRKVRGLGRVGGESVAIEKDSDDPYLDFRHSMLQMILEKEIYNKDDLRELLNCFLQLNSPYHHGIIVRAFTEIWNGVLSVRSYGGGGGYSEKEKLHYYYGCKSRDI